METGLFKGEKQNMKKLAVIIFYQIMFDKSMVSLGQKWGKFSTYLLLLFPPKPHKHGILSPDSTLFVVQK